MEGLAVVGERRLGSRPAPACPAVMGAIAAREPATRFVVLHRPSHAHRARQPGTCEPAALRWHRATHSGRNIDMINSSRCSPQKNTLPRAIPSAMKPTAS